MSKRQRRYCLTLNNPTEEEMASLNALNARVMKRAIFALETGAKGTEHIQGFVHLKNAKSLTAFKKFCGSNRMHVETAHGTDFESWAYCSKGEQSKEEWDSQGLTGPNYGKNASFFTVGEEPLEEGELDAWEQILQMIEGGFNNRQIARKFPAIAIRCMSAICKYRTEFEWAECRRWRDIEVEYIGGPTGCGKSRGVLYNEDGSVNTDVYRCTNAKNPFDMYDGESIIVFEEFRSQFTCRDMLNWIDGHPLLLPARYADRMAHFEKVVILSNWRFTEQYSGTATQSPETYKAWQRRVGTITELW